MHGKQARTGWSVRAKRTKRIYTFKQVCVQLSVDFICCHEDLPSLLSICSLKRRTVCIFSLTHIEWHESLHYVCTRWRSLHSAVDVFLQSWTTSDLRSPKGDLSSCTEEDFWGWIRNCCYWDLPLLFFFFFNMECALNQLVKQKNIGNKALNHKYILEEFRKWSKWRCFNGNRTTISDPRPSSKRTLWSSVINCIPWQAVRLLTRKCDGETETSWQSMSGWSNILFWSSC